jgi:hypothetical protein
MKMISGRDGLCLRYPRRRDSDMALYHAHLILEIITMNLAPCPCPVYLQAFKELPNAHCVLHEVLQPCMLVFTPSVKKTHDCFALALFTTSSIRIGHMASIRLRTHVKVNQKIGVLRPSFLRWGDLDELVWVRRRGGGWRHVVGEFLELFLFFSRDLEVPSIIGRCSTVDVRSPLHCYVGRAFWRPRSGDRIGWDLEGGIEKHVASHRRWLPRRAGRIWRWPQHRSHTVRTTLADLTSALVAAHGCKSQFWSNEANGWYFVGLAA